MTTTDDLIAKDAIRELVLLYSRGVDRKDLALLRTLYTKDGTDHHGSHFSGSAEDYLHFLERSLPHVHVGMHLIGNHLISVVDGDTAEGEVYGVAYHIVPDGKGGTVEDVAGVRYIDRYRKEDGRWKFASRVVAFDWRNVRPVTAPAVKAPTEDDASYATLASRLFARGARA